MFVLMDYPADAKSTLARWGWNVMMAGRAGGAAGVVDWRYPVSGLAAADPGDEESPSTEIMVCRRA